MSRREESELADTVAAPGDGTLPTAASGSATATATATAIATPGTRIGRYELRTRLGAGAMGEVWEAHDPQLDRKIAIKLVHPRVASSPEIAARMAREARAMAKVSHRAVVTVYDAGEANEQLFLAMELVRGRSLGAVLRTRSADEVADWKRWLQMMVDAGHGLAAAHEAGVLHRDFKPDNVLVDDKGRVCVGDFGLASLGDRLHRVSRPVLDATIPDAELTATGTLLGTPAYMSREQMFGDQVDARADQFSFCVATYEALYGERPFAPGAGTNLAALMDALDRGDIRPVPAGSRVPALVRAALVRGLAASADRRWPSMNELLAELETALIPASATASIPRTRRRSRRLVVAVGLVAIAALVGLLASRREPSSPTAPAVLPTADAALPRPAAHLVQRLAARAVFALSPSGYRAVGTYRIEVHAPGEAAPRQFAVPPHDGLTPWVDHPQFDGDDVLYWTSRNQNHRYRWNLRNNAPPQETKADTGGFLGHVLDGELVFSQTSEGAYVLRFTRGQEIVESWPVNEPVEIVAVSPDKKRVAFLETVDRNAGRIVVLDIETSSRQQTEPVTLLTALAWRTNEELLYAASNPAVIYELTVGSGSFSAPRVAYEPKVAWVGALASNASTALYSDLTWTTRGRILSTVNAPPRDFDPGQTSALLGWTDATHFVAWNRGTRQLEVRDVILPGVPLGLEVAGEPQNATLAGTTLVVTLRGMVGRSVAAFDLSSMKMLWSRPENELLAVRCAGDRQEPCLAAQRLPGDAERYALVPINPVTGELGSTRRYEGSVNDFALDLDGKRLAVATGVIGQLVEIAGTSSRVLGSSVYRPRTLAYLPSGGLVIGGTASDALYVVVLDTDGRTRNLSQSDSEMVVLARPSYDGSSVIAMTRTYNNDLWELTLPPLAK